MTVAPRWADRAAELPPSWARVPYTRACIVRGRIVWLGPPFALDSFGTAGTQETPRASVFLPAGQDPQQPDPPDSTAPLVIT